MQTKGQILCGLFFLLSIFACRSQTNQLATNQVSGFTLCSNATGYVWVPNSVIASINFNSNRIYALQAKSATDQKKFKDDVRLIWARQSAGGISATAASNQEGHLRKRLFEGFKPGDKEIAQRRLSNLRLRRAYKLDDIPDW